MKFSDMEWKYTVKLARPTSAKPKIITENE
jgi:hypothetical protein